MQIDMHYYGVYALAYTAGMNPETARIVATSSQFVDDLADKIEINFHDAGQFNCIATAHHSVDTDNIDKDDQRNVWVPFHFIPGNYGSSFTEKLVCTKDSKISQSMLQDALDATVRAHGPYRIGIAAHVYADTFSHYGFSGVSSRLNRVDNGTINLNNVSDGMIQYITNKAERIFQSKEYLTENIKSMFAEGLSGALGHGAVATYPDRPYLIWDFEYEEPARPSGVRNNPLTYLEACEKLFDFFRRVISTNQDYKNPGAGDVEFSKIKDAVFGILNFQGKEEERSNKWREAASLGEITDEKFTIPDYDGMNWLEQLNDLRSGDSSEIILNDAGFLFSVAAHEHRDHVIHHLLPMYNIVVA